MNATNTISVRQPNPQVRRNFAAEVLFAAFLLTTLLVPGAIFNKALFAVICFWIALRLYHRPSKRVFVTPAPLLIIMVFLYGCLLAQLGDADLDLSLQFLLSGLTLFIIYFIRSENISIDQHIKAGGLIVAAVTWSLFVLFASIPNAGMTGSLADAFFRYSFGAAGARDFLGHPVTMFHVGTAPFLFLPFCLFARDLIRRTSLSAASALLLIGSAILISSSRALVVVCGVAFLWLLITNRATKTMSVSVVVALALVIANADFQMLSMSALSFSEESNAVKLGHALSFVEHLNVRTALFGDGLGAYYYSAGRDDYVAHTEITLLDSIRYFGVPLAFFSYFLLTFPSNFKKGYLENRGFALMVFGLYLALSMTNPVLFNSYGLIVVVWYWTKVLPPAYAQRGGIARNSKVSG